MNYLTNFSLHLMPKMQVAEQKTDRLINSTRQILENIYKQAFLTNSNWPVGVLSKKVPKFNLSESDIKSRAERNQLAILSLLLTQLLLETR